MLNRGYSQILICMDSKLAVEILNMHYNCPWRALPLVGKIKQALEELESFRIQHVWHEANQGADFLAAYATGNDEILLYPTDSPRSLLDIIRNDAEQCIYTHV